MVSAATFPTIIPAHVLGREGNVAANERVHIGIIGTGGRGAHLTRFMPPAGRVVAISDCMAEHMERVQARNPESDWAKYQDYRQMFDKEKLDAVVVATTDQNRVLASVLACQAGLDVYAEKHLTLTIAEGKTLVKAVRKYERVCQVGTHQRSMQPDAWAADLVRGGAIGKVHTVIARQYKPPRRYTGLSEEPIPKGLDWNLWTGPAMLHPYNHRLQKKLQAYQGWAQCWDYSGGDVTLHGAHAADQIQNTLGKDDTGPVEIWPISDEPDAEVRMKYADGTLIRFEREEGVQWGAVFIGEKGKIEINRGRVASNPKELVADAPKVAGSAAEPHLQNWLDCIKTRQKPIADVEIGHRAVNLCHPINICREVGRKLRWDPDSEDFVDDPAASALLDRPRRKGFELPRLAS
ncbi:MAG: Gfo/Idh/MocA family oxidoreductase [Planctomycetota bacterium]